MSLNASYFDHLFDADADPWQFRTRDYETRKRMLTMACLPERHYRSCFEPGAAIGVLSTELARRCDQVLAMDISATAVRLAQDDLPQNVLMRQGAVPHDWPTGSFDLVVLSEVGYYLDQEDCSALTRLAARSAHDLVAVHWRHPVAEYPLSGDEVHELLAEAALAAGMQQLVDHREADLRIDVWSHDARSVAVRTGVPHQ
jgi:Nodulation protein S (NodS)